MKEINEVIKGYEDNKIQKELDGIKEVFRKEGLHYDKIGYYLFCYKGTKAWRLRG